MSLVTPPHTTACRAAHHWCHCRCVAIAGTTIRSRLLTPLCYCFWCQCRVVVAGDAIASLSCCRRITVAAAPVVSPVSPPHSTADAAVVSPSLVLLLCGGCGHWCHHHIVVADAAIASQSPLLCRSCWCYRHTATTANPATVAGITITAVAAVGTG